MFRRTLVAVWIALFVTSAGASPGAQKPSELMAASPTVKNGRIGPIRFKIDATTTDKAAALRCIKIFTDHGMTAKMSITSGTGAAKDVFAVEGTREYAEANASADSLLAQASAAVAGNPITWTVSQTTSGWK